MNKFKSFLLSLKENMCLNLFITVIRLTYASPIRSNAQLNIRYRWCASHFMQITEREIQSNL